jgi:hypothetical protein
MPAVGTLSVDLVAMTASFNSQISKAAANLNANAAKMKGSLAGIEAGLARAGNAAKGFGAVLAGSVVVAAGKRALDYASSLGEVSQQLGVTSKDLQIYRYAATQVGVSQDEMDRGLAKLTQSIGKASLGAKSQSDAFAALGLSVRDANGNVKTAGQVIPEIAGALEKVSNPAQRAAVEVELFGKAGQKLDTLLAGGKGQIDELAGAAKRLGLVLSDEQIQKADVTADKLSAMKTVLEARIAGAVAENATSILTLANNLLKLAGVLESHPVLLSGAAGAAIGARFGPGGAILGGITGLGLGGYMSGQADDANMDVAFRAQKAREAAALLRKRAKAFPNASMTAGSTVDTWLQNARKQQQLLAQATSLARSGSAPKSLIAANDDGIANFLASKGGGSGKVAKSIEDPIAEMMKSVDIDIRNMPLVSQMDLPKQITEAEDRWKEFTEFRKREDDRLNQYQQMQVQNLANLYENAFRGGTDAIWKDFKGMGLRVVAEVLAKFALAKLGGGGGGFNLGSAISTAFSSVLGFAGGGSPPVGRWSIVGERGPELFKPRSAGTVIPNHMLGGARAGPVINQTIQFSGAVDIATRSEVFRIADAARLAAMRGVGEARRRSA